MIALTPLKTCFECRHALVSSNENGMRSANCLCPTLSLKKYDSLAHQCDENTLPAFCGCFAAKRDKCNICGKQMTTVTFMSTAKGMTPICSPLCALKQEKIDESG